MAVHNAENLIKTAEVATALTLEALLGISDAFDERTQKVRPHGGQVITARNIRKLIVDSRLIQTGREATEKNRRPHDPYSLRCAPQVLGVFTEVLLLSIRFQCLDSHIHGTF